MTLDLMMTELARPFPDKYVRTNPSGGGSYVPHHVVEQRLIAVLGIPPAFSLVEVLRGDVPGIVPNPEGSSKRAKQGVPPLEGAVVGVVARMTVTIGDREVTVEEAGDCEDPHNWPHDGARLKDAMSDAYKRCAMRLGCGLHLWSAKHDEFFLFDQLRSGAEGASGGGAPSALPESGAEEGADRGARRGRSSAPPTSEGGATSSEGDGEGSTGDTVSREEAVAPPSDCSHVFKNSERGLACSKCGLLKKEVA